MEKEKILFNGAWNSIFGMEIHSSEHLHDCFINNPNWDNSMDQSDPFESALSSIVSSPANSHSGIPIPASGDSVVLRELIGRLGSICNSGDISPHSYINGNNNSTNTSGYTTPLNSPPKLNLSIMDHQIPGNLWNQHQLPLPSDPGASRFSSFSGNKFMGIQQEIDEIPASDKKFSRLAVSSTPENTELGDSMEESSVSEHIPGGGIGIKSQSQSTHNNGRKRKAIPKGKVKETPSSTLSAKDDKIVAEEQKEESEAKRSKSNEGDNGKEKAEWNEKKTKENAKAAEPPKDYIHVRARRGQATDSHSLAERVRREKISERMKFLQDLVPGCNKVTGKAVMLDEIINYVQSLQRQVEFLSMKLATVNPRMDVTMEALLSKDMFQSLSSMANNINHLDNSPQPFHYGFQSQHNGLVLDGKFNRSSMNPSMVAMHCDSNMKPPHIDGFGEASTFWENDLQSVVQMGLGQNQPQIFHGSMATGQMKVEQ